MRALSRTTGAAAILMAWLVVAGFGAAGKLASPAMRGLVVALTAITAGSLAWYLVPRLRGGWSAMWRFSTHAGLMLLLIGGAVSGVTRRAGRFPITEGEAVPLGLAGAERTTVALRRLQPRWEGVRLAGCEAVLDWRGADGPRAATARLGHPVRVAGVALHQEAVVEPAASIRVTAAGVDAVTCLSFESENPARFVSGRPPAAVWHVPGSDIVLEGRLYPDYRLGPGGPETQSPAVKNPRLFARVSRAGAMKGGGALIPGESFGVDGVTVQFLEARYWTRFLEVRDPGAPVAFAGFGLSAAGLAGIVARRWRAREAPSG